MKEYLMQVCDELPKGWYEVTMVGKYIGKNTETVIRLSSGKNRKGTEKVRVLIRVINKPNDFGGFI